LPRPHAKQQDFISSLAKRKIIRAGRRGGKTKGVGILGVEKFCAHCRVLYAAPTSEQIGRFWTTVVNALQEPIDKGFLYKNESDHIIEISESYLKMLAANPDNNSLMNMYGEARIRAKTAWNADTLRGDYADVLILDEWQLMHEEAWGLVGAPMLLDTNGDAVFIYTPPSLRSRAVSRAKDPQHAAKMFKRYQELQKTKPERYAAFHFTSMDNPYISEEALEDITNDMTSVAYRMEILAEDVLEVPGALWTRDNIQKNRVYEKLENFDRIVVAIDPSATSTGDEAGIITAGKKADHGYVLKDSSLQGSPLAWAQAAVKDYHDFKANKIVAEKNNGGEMVALTIAQVDRSVPVELVHASQGKAVRAEPVSALYEKDRGHHCGEFPYLEDELCMWQPGSGNSPNRLDALVWAYVGLGLAKMGGTRWADFVG
jgi:hypothetical protein